MPMPTLDPSRFYAVVLADPSHTLPLPIGRNFFADGEVVDSADPFFGHLLADGSLVRKLEDAPKPESASDPAPTPKTESSAPSSDPTSKPAPSAVPTTKA